MIKVVPYDPTWPEIFEAEAHLLKQTLGDNLLEIHHVGSTSIPGLAAKPIIDIIASCHEIQKAIADLKTAEYDFRGNFNQPFRFFFNNKNRTLEIHLYISEPGNTETNLNLLFRDYLKQNSKARLEYEELKKDLASKEDSVLKQGKLFKKYTMEKHYIIQKILNDAGFDDFLFRFCAHNLEWENYHRIREEQIFNPINVAYDKNHPTLTDPNHFHFVLYKGITIVTAAQVELINEHEATLHHLATDTPYQGKGYEKHMLSLIEKWVKQQNWILKKDL